MNKGLQHLTYKKNLKKGRLSREILAMCKCVVGGEKKMKPGSSRWYAVEKIRGNKHRFKRKKTKTPLFF